MSARPIACAATSWTSTSGGPRGWPRPEKSSQSAACGSSSILCPTTWPRITPGSTHPEYFIQGDDEDLRRDPASFIAAGGKVLACGRDPYFPAWPDVLQLNAFHPGLRSAAVETVAEIAEQCDGVRCDMAMLMMSDIFERTWGPRAGARPAEDYWPTLIPAVQASHPEFRFIAEAYWDLEWALQQQGFRLLLRQAALRPDGT